VSPVLGAIFFLDPLFAQSYRGARTDSWVLALCLGSCWITRSVATRALERRASSLRLAAAGALAAAAFFVYPTAPLLYPLILVEVISVSRESRSVRGSHRSVMSSLGAFAFGGLAARGNRLLAITTALLAIYVLSTRVYTFHVVYFLPYLLALAGGALAAGATSDPRSKLLHARRIALAALLVWAATVTMVARPLAALSEEAGRDPSIPLKLGRLAIGTGPKRVYIGAMEFYYAGRELGWQMFAPWFGETQGQQERMLSQVDFALLYKPTVGSALPMELAKAGLRPERTLASAQGARSGWLRSLPLAQAQPYGPYEVYAR
jgi:hypothetical protein